MLTPFPVVGDFAIADFLAPLVQFLEMVLGHAPAVGLGLFAGVGPQAADIFQEREHRFAVCGRAVEPAAHGGAQSRDRNC